MLLGLTEIEAVGAGGGGGGGGAGVVFFLQALSRMIAHTIAVNAKHFSCSFLMFTLREGVNG